MKYEIYSKYQLVAAKRRPVATQTRTLLELCFLDRLPMLRRIPCGKISDAQGSPSAFDVERILRWILPPMSGCQDLQLFPTYDTSLDCLRPTFKPENVDMSLRMRQKFEVTLGAFRNLTTNLTFFLSHHIDNMHAFLGSASALDSRRRAMSKVLGD